MYTAYKFIVGLSAPWPSLTGHASAKMYYRLIVLVQGCSAIDIGRPSSLFGL